MKIAVVTSEAVPFAKTGGLADVSGVLPQQLADLGHEVILLLPYYQTIKDKKLAVKEVKGEDVYSLELSDKINIYFIDHEKYYNYPQLYGIPKGDYPDNAQRFGYFCRKSLELLSRIGFQPDIIHTNDWQTGLIPLYLKTNWKDKEFYQQTKTIFTIHNMAYLGLFPSSVMPELCLDQELFNPFTGIEFFGRISFLKAALVFADAISTVSEKYSQEIQTEEYGCGLDGLLQQKADHIYGILNGVDYSQWNPEVDEHIKSNYSDKDLSGKIACRQDLLKEYSLTASPKTPVIGIISRLADQKGFDILTQSLERLFLMDLRIVLLGAGDEKYHQLFKWKKREHPRRFGVRIDFDNALAHKIEAGSDIFLMPSRYEPCGLNQIYSLKYGTVPVVRATGGLDDTIVNFDPETGKGNGFKFTEYNSSALIETIERVLSVYRNKELWKRLMLNGMQEDFSWSQSARKYVKMYEEVLNRV